MYGKVRYEKMKVYAIAGSARRYKNLFCHSSRSWFTLFFPTSTNADALLMSAITLSARCAPACTSCKTHRFQPPGALSTVRLYHNIL